MMKTIRCDCCGRSEPDVWCRYSKVRKRKFTWFQKNDDSQGGWERELDLCEECWANLSTPQQKG